MSAAPIGTMARVEPFPIPERDTIVPGFYRESGEQSNHDQNPQAVVTCGGEPIRVNGETLTIAMLPPERRFAVQVCEDGKTAEVYAQDVFANRHRMWWEAELLFKNARATDPSKWPVPNVKNFVSVKIREHDGAIWPLGMPCDRQAPKVSAQVYDPKADRIISREEFNADIEAMVEAKLADRIKRLATEEDRAVVAEAAKPAAEMFTTPCGAKIKGEGYMHLHVRHCKKGCNESKEA